jgi:probable HAF family extracellular repeat protein
MYHHFSEETMNSQHFLQRRGQYQRVGVWRALVLVWVVVAWAAQPSLAQRLIWLGTLGGDVSNAYGVSADGSVVVGGSYNAARQWHAFRWTASGGMQDLGTLGGSESGAWGVSADGSVVVGEAQSAAGPLRAFRWTEASGMQDLGTLGGDESVAYGVSADGSVVVGVAYNAAGQKRAFRWTAARGMQDLGTLPGGAWSEAWGVSADGSIVVGWDQNDEGDSRPFRSTAAGRMQALCMLPSGCQSEAYGVSADGSVVVGKTWSWLDFTSLRRWRAFRWTAAHGMRYLGTLPGDYESEALGVSANDSIVVGRAWNAANQYSACRWTAAGRMEDLNFTYANLLTDGSVLLEARAISPDGRYIVGKGRNATTGREEAFLLDTRRTWR